MQKSKSSLILFFLLVVSNLFWGVLYFSTRESLSEARMLVENQTINSQIVNFSRLFIDDVLKAEGEVDFDKRLELENAVRALKDPLILSQWGKFVNSPDEVTAQSEVKNLLSLLIDKIKTQ